jgi:hypothetical protein
LGDYGLLEGHERATLQSCRRDGAAQRSQQQCPEGVRQGEDRTCSRHEEGQPDVRYAAPDTVPDVAQQGRESRRPGQGRRKDDPHLRAREPGHLQRDPEQHAPEAVSERSQAPDKEDSPGVRGQGAALLLPFTPLVEGVVYRHLNLEKPLVIGYGG